MKLLSVLIATLVKSISASYTLVGTGGCLDSAGAFYDLVQMVGQVQDISAAYNWYWCLTATAYSSSLVGVEVGTSNGYWRCAFDNGSINNIKVTDFTPTANGGILLVDIGNGAVASSFGNNDYQCWRNDVCPIYSNCMISFLSFSHGSRSPPILLY
jgi:hypothetical protein